MSEQWYFGLSDFVDNRQPYIFQANRNQGPYGKLESGILYPVDALFSAQTEYNISISGSFEN
jgi:hypothetical protein